jgi:hypothetical protein
MRKPTYLKRKEEQAALKDEVERLQRQVADLQAEKDGGFRILNKSMGLNAALKDTLEQQRLAVATTQSLMSRQLQTGNPLNIRIHLGREWTERHEMLQGMKDERLAQGFRYVIARNQHLDILKPHMSEEQFEDAQGDFCCVRNDVIPFPGVRSMRTMFDALKITLNTLEICISEQLGHITVRDDYDVMGTDSFIANYRLASGINSGVTTELNVVACGQYFEEPNMFGGEPFGVLAVDSVDEDDLHPYHLKECVRKVIHGTVVLAPVPSRKSTSRKGSSGKGGDTARDETDVEIVMLRSFFVKTCQPEFEISETVNQELRDTATRWADVALQAARGLIYS